MIRYCFINDLKTGLVQLGVGCSEEYYKEIGMLPQDVKQSDIDFRWYLADKCPMKSEEQKKQEEKDAKINALKSQLRKIDENSIRSLRDGDAEYVEKYRIEAEKVREELRKIGANNV